MCAWNSCCGPHTVTPLNHRLVSCGNADFSRNGSKTGNQILLLDWILSMKIPTWKFFCDSKISCAKSSTLPLIFLHDSVASDGGGVDSSGHMVCERTVWMPSISTVLLAVEARNEVWGPLPEALPLAQVLNLSQNPSLHLSSFVSVHRPSFPPWTPAWLWRDRGGLWAGP